MVLVGPWLGGTQVDWWDPARLVGPNPHGVRGTLPTRSLSFLLLQIFMIFVAINSTNTDTPPIDSNIFSEEFSPGSLIKAGRMSLICDMSNKKLRYSSSPFATAYLSSSLGSLYLMVGLGWEQVQRKLYQCGRSARCTRAHTAENTKKHQRPPRDVAENTRKQPCTWWRPPKVQKYQVKLHTTENTPM